MTKGGDLMTELIPQWIFKPYSKLWIKYKNKPFTFKEAMELLDVKEQRILSDIFSEMKKANWLTSKRDPESPRNRIFRLRNFNTITKELLIEYSQ